MIDNENIKQIGINHFLEMVFQTGTECLREGKEAIMGEAKRLRDAGIEFKQLQPGQQIQVDLKNAEQKKCECGCEFFMAGVTIHIISPLLSPIGKELMATQPALICLSCKKPWKPGEDGGNGIDVG